MNEKLNEFLKELTKLSRKYGLVINGCGCCGSPFVTEEDVAENSFYNANYESMDYLVLEKNHDSS